MQIKNDNTISIRLLTKEDRVDFDRLNKKYKKEISKYCPENVSAWEMETFIDSPFQAGYAIFKRFSEEEMIQFIENYDMCDQDEPSRYEDGQIVGFILCDYDNYTWNGSCYIHQFYVDDAFRRQGIGMLAMKCLLEKEWKFTLHVMKNNEPAQKFWRAVERELKLDGCFETSFIKMETSDSFCDFFYWESRMMQRFLNGAFTYNVAVPFPAGNNIYESVSDLMVHKHEVFDAWYDKFGKLVIVDDNEVTGKKYYMILDDEESIVVFEDRTQVYVVTDPDFIVEEKLFESLNTKVKNIKEYLVAFQKWQRESQFTARHEFYRSPWEEDDNEELFFDRPKSRHNFQGFPFRRKRRRRR